MLKGIEEEGTGVDRPESMLVDADCPEVKETP